MPDLLLELFCEEIPARMQANAADALRKMVTDALVERGLMYEGAKAFVTPRRLALAVHGLPANQPDVHEERKGPRVGAPEAALEGFLKASGLASIDQARIVSDPKKGEFYVAHIHKHGRTTPEVIAEIVPEIIRAFPWPKSMRWGSGSLKWVRPLQSIVCTFGPETEEPEIVPFEVDGIRSGDTTRGHRFLSKGTIRVRRLADWQTKLEAAFVVADRERRKDIILNDAKDLALAQGLELVEDPGLLDEISGLVEWPVVLMGTFDEGFLDVPDEVVRATIRINQKCFVLRDPATGRLANKFVLVSNLAASDGGAAIIAGNERVIRARLSDAKFFWDTDRKTNASTSLDERLAKFRNVTFHEKLGSQFERIERIAALAKVLAPLVGADPELAEQAARYAKADLRTEVVGEFPEVQGLMGKYYARLEGLPEEIALAAEEHYKPQGPTDRVPTAPVSVAVALADKLDTLVGFWAIDEKPTGSKDPYALRRAALGVVRIVLDNKSRLDLTKLLIEHGDRFDGHDAGATAFALVEFVADRLKVQLREQGARFDLVDAVLETGVRKETMMPGMGNVRDLVPIVARIEALGRFLSTEDGKNLLAGYKRAANILRIEEKKDGATYEGGVDVVLLHEPEERALADAIATARPLIEQAVAAEDFEGAMGVMSSLRAPVDAFFEKVTVNATEPELRKNRLRLLADIRNTTRTIADFDRIEG